MPSIHGNMSLIQQNANWKEMIETGAVRECYPPLLHISCCQLMIPAIIGCHAMIHFQPEVPQLDINVDAIKNKDSKRTRQLHLILL